MSESRGKTSRDSRALPERKVVLVGAAGFEPTTCSTQNCRATRLRYTPNIQGNDVDTRLRHCQQGCSRSVSSAVKERMRYPVAWRDPVFLRRACDHLQHPLHGPS